MKVEKLPEPYVCTISLTQTEADYLSMICANVAIGGASDNHPNWICDRLLQLGISNWQVLSSVNYDVTGNISIRKKNQ